MTYPKHCSASYTPSYLGDCDYGTAEEPCWGAVEIVDYYQYDTCCGVPVIACAGHVGTHLNEPYVPEEDAS